MSVNSYGMNRQGARHALLAIGSHRKWFCRYHARRSALSQSFVLYLAFLSHLALFALSRRRIPFLSLVFSHSLSMSLSFSLYLSLSIYLDVSKFVRLPVAKLVVYVKSPFYARSIVVNINWNWQLLLKFSHVSAAWSLFLRLVLISLVFFRLFQIPCQERCLYQNAPSTT